MKIKKTMQEIADIIGFSKRTIQHEKKHGMVTLQNTDLSFYDAYSATAAQNKYEAKQKSKQGYLKIDKNIALANFIEEQIIKNKLSPYAAFELAKKIALL